MKTTVEIPEGLFREAKAVAAERGVTFRELVESGLRHAIGGKRTRKKFKLRRASFRGNGLVPGLTWEGIRDHTYGDRSG